MGPVERFLGLFAFGQSFGGSYINSHCWFSRHRVCNDRRAKRGCESSRRQLSRVSLWQYKPLKKKKCCFLTSWKQCPPDSLQPAFSVHQFRLARVGLKPENYMRNRKIRAPSGCQSLGCDWLNTTNSLVDQWPPSSGRALLKATHLGVSRHEMDSLFCPRKKMKLAV